MAPELVILIISAASIAFVHTLLGPDHYVPFIAMAKARGWSLPKTLRVVLLCGSGHLVGSVALGILGIVAGIELTRLLPATTLINCTVAVIGTYRRDEVGPEHKLSTLVANPDRIEQLFHFELGPLGHDAVLQLLSDESQEILASAYVASSSSSRLPFLRLPPPLP